MTSAKKFEELIAWQLSEQLRSRVYEFTREGKARRDPQFCEQIRRSATSVPANIAEGFARFDPPQFASFLTIARGSLAETMNHLKHGRTESYWSEEAFNTAWNIACRATRAINRLHEYLRNCPRSKKPSRAAGTPRPTPKRTRPP
jgi:four helix bundle protein